MSLILTLLFGSAFSQYQLRSGVQNNIKVKKNYSTKSTKNSTIYYEDFESGNLDSWTTYDEDGDGRNWGIPESGNQSHSGWYHAASESWNAGAITPNNWLISPAIDLSGVSGTISLDYFVGPKDSDWPDEHYKCVISKKTNTPSDFTTILYEETVVVGSENGFTKRSINISEYINETIYIAWVHYDCTDMFQLMLDDVLVYKNTSIDAGITGVKAPTNENGCGLTNEEDVTVSIFNYGGQPISTVIAEYTISSEQVSETTTVTETVTDINILPGASIDYTFTQKADLSVLGYYNMDFSITLDNDDDLTNNTFKHQLTNGDAKITVHTLSDGNGGEIWTIKNSAGSVIATGPDYQWDAEDIIDICVISDDCYSLEFTGFDATGWMEVLYNDQVIGGGQTPGNTVGGVTFYGIGNNCLNTDLGLIDINLPTFSEPKEINIGGKVINFGLSNISSFDVIYKIDDHTSSTYNISGLDLKIGEEYEFVHDVPFNFDTDGDYNVTIEVSNPNGITDENLENNSSSQAISIITGLMYKKQIFEHFTSSTCGPCATYTPTADALLGANKGNYSLIRYQVNWPDNGDPYYIQAAGVRVNYYNVNGVPSVYRNGTFDMGVTQEGFDVYAAQPTSIGIEAKATYNDNNVSVEATIKSNASVAEGLKAHIVIIENKTTKNKGTNGETEFENVMMAMLPSSSGTTLEAFAANESKMINETYDMSTTFVEEMSDLTAVIFVQDDLNKEVMQSIMIPIELGSGINHSEELSVSIFPNPFSNKFTVANLNNASQIIISNILGQALKTVNIENLTTTTIPTSDLQNGIYMITVIDNKNNKRTERVVKQ